MSEDINKLKTEVAVINTKLDALADKQDETIELLKSHILEEGKNREEMLKTKADKVEVDELKDNQKWVIRSILGIVIAAIVGLVINQ